MPAIIFTAAALSNYRVQFPNGSIFGAGTAANLVEITGLRDMTVRSGDAPRGQADGAYAGMNYVGERSVVIKWDVTLAQNGTEEALQLLAAAYQNVQDPSSVCMTGGSYLGQTYGLLAKRPPYMLQFMLPGRAAPLWLFGRPTKFNVPIDLNYQYGKVQVITEWTSPDGLIYDGAPFHASTQLADPSAGFTFPAAFPWYFGASSGGGAMTVTNNGFYEANPYFTLGGPLTNPTITNATTGQKLSLNITLGDMDFLEIDTQSGNVTLNGTANRNTSVAVGSSFFKIQPGVTVLDFTSKDSTHVSGTFNCYLMPTYSAV